MAELLAGFKLNYEVYITMLFFEVVLFAILFYFAYRVISLTKCKNLRITILMIFMNLTMVTSIILKIQLSLMFSNLLHNTENYEFDQALLYTLIELPVLMLELTIIVNLNQWAFYFIKIREFTNKLKEQSRGKTTERRTRIMNVITISIAFVIVYFEFGYVIELIMYQKN